MINRILAAATLALTMTGAAPAADHCPAAPAQTISACFHVYYRTCVSEPWYCYGQYYYACDAYAAARYLRSQGYEAYVG
jgi:hypothetical protein